MPRYDVRPHRGTRRLTFMMGPTATRCQITRPRERQFNYGAI